MKILHLIQPGRIGDIIICLPIAKEYFDKGYQVRWYINHQYLRLFDYIDYVVPIVLSGNLNQNLIETYSIIARSEKGKIIDIGIGFSQHKETQNFLGGNKHFDEWKYDKANVDINKKYNLIFNRNRIKEENLKKYLKIKKPYKIIHLTASNGKYFDLKIKGIEVKPIENYTLFDWYSILKEAEEIYCIDSCVLNFVNQLGLCVGRRYVRFWRTNPLLSPIVKEDWKIL